MATAHAKARLSPKVESTDASAAEAIMRYALFKDVPNRQRRKKRKLNNGGAVRRGDDDSGEEGEEDEEEEATEDEEEPKRMTEMPLKDDLVKSAASGPGSPRNQGAVDREGSQTVHRTTQDLDMDDVTLAGTNEAGAIRPERWGFHHTMHGLLNTINSMNEPGVADCSSSGLGWQNSGLRQCRMTIQYSLRILLLRSIPG